MIKKALFEEELVYGMQRELQGFEKNAAMGELVKGADYLQAAMEIFEEVGLTAQADQVLNILHKIAADENADFGGKKPDHSKEDKSRYDSADAKGKPRKPKNPAKIHDPHTSGLTPEKMVENLKHHGIVFNLADDGKANDYLDVELSDDNDLEVFEENPEHKSFEDES